jgi:Outer membrane protein beta-barrel domain
MKNSLVFMIMAAALIFTNSVVAQSTDEYNKREIFVGYTSHSYPDDDRIVVEGRGVNISGVYNVKRWVGIKADVSYAIGKKESSDFDPFFNNPTREPVKYSSRLEIKAATAGVQIKNNSSEGRFKPFGHFLMGVGQYKKRVTDITCTTVSNCSLIPKSGKQSLAVILGGGLDIKLNKRIDIRAFQFDIHTVKDGDGSFRFSSGIVFKF